MKRNSSVKRINQMFEYIETALASGEEVQFNKISQILCENKLSSDRIFRFLTGYTLNEYVKKRKMSLAGMDLYANQDKVIDIAVKYGYSSSQAFSRAFKKFFGFNPSEVRDEQMELKLFVPFVHIDELDAEELKFKILEKEEFCLHSVSMFAGETKELVGGVARKFWKDFDKNKIKGQQYGMSQPTENGYVYHIASDMPFGGSKPFCLNKSKWAVFIIDVNNRSEQQNILKIVNFWKDGSGFVRDMSLPVIEKYFLDKLEVFYPIKYVKKH